MDPQKITELANLLRKNGDKLLNSESTFTLSGSMLRALNDSFTLIADSAEGGDAHNFQVVKPINHKSPVFRDLQLIYDFVQKTTMLCIKHYPTDDYFEGCIDISKFRALQNLEIQKTKVKQIVGIQPLRSQMQELKCIRSLSTVDEIITKCGGDNSNGFVWNELKRADFSYNNLQTVDTSLEFAQYLQHLNLRHNQLKSVEAIKWLPQLKTLDVSFNCLQYIPIFHTEACKRLQSLNMNNNYVESLNGVSKLEAITDLDLSDNCLLDHSSLLPISALLTLKFLNLFGNPLACHPKHRLATAQFLHKNCATVRFILDFSELTKNEKAVTGKHQLRHVGSLMARSTSTNISLNSEPLTTHGTPASSVGSLRSFKFFDSKSDIETPKSMLETAAKKRSSKQRTVEIQDIDVKDEVAQVNDEASAKYRQTQIVDSQHELLNKSLNLETSTDHLEAKEQITTLRERYGTEWLQYGNAEMLKSVISNKSSLPSEVADSEQNTSRQLFNDFLGEFSKDKDPDSMNIPANTSTPTSEKIGESKNYSEEVITPIKSTNVDSGNETIYLSTEVDPISPDTIYNSALSNSDNKIVLEKKHIEDAVVDDEPLHLKNVYSTTADDEPEISETEDDEKVYIVSTPDQEDSLFLTISSNFLREKDAITEKTKAKWSLKILESCDRLKSNTLRINFDTVKLDKQERIYVVEDGLCQELEKLLRDILSKRDLTEMNQTIYCCVNCTCQFSHEIKNKLSNQEIRCPDCKSIFVAEIHNIPKPRTLSTEEQLSLSPATIVEESPITTPLVVDMLAKNAEAGEDSNSIGSANSLNESSSCSKITNSQSSFDSNQSVVGSTNTERENEMNCESDVDILSNPSQSSIEVLDHMIYGGRKTSSEERRISQTPALETIEDQSYRADEFDVDENLDAIHKNNGNIIQSNKRKLATAIAPVIAPITVTATATASSGPLAHFALTESSSSGSITDSICTAYEQQSRKTATLEEKQNSDDIIGNTLPSEQDNSKDIAGVEKNDNELMKREESGLSSVFGALIQSTNLLMSGSKKLLDAESAVNIVTGTVIQTNSATAQCIPYKFNYNDYNDIDHRLKLYFYQMKFEEEGEHFKWIARGRIFIKSTSTACEGIVVISTCKLYLMEIYAPEHDNVAKWIKQVMCVSADQLECIQLLPWKIGLSFRLNGCGGFLLLLKDIVRTNSLLSFLEDKSLPGQCKLLHESNEMILKRLTQAIDHEKLEMLAMLNRCIVTLDTGKRIVNNCMLLTTDTHIHLTTDQLKWLAIDNDNDDYVEMEICIKQYMTNLIEIERTSDTIAVLIFLDETQETSSTWTCHFETKHNANSCLITMSKSWEKKFGVPLLTHCEF